MSLPAISIRNPVFAWMLMLFFIVFGAIAFWRLPVGLLPDVDYPFVSIQAQYDGAAPEIMESDVVNVLEDAVMAVEGIREITSICKNGQAWVNMEFDLSRDIESALQDVQARVAQATRLLPKDMDPVSITKTSTEEQPVMWVALSGTRSQQEISEYAKNILRDRFLTVEGNGDVTMGGYLQRNVRIWLNAAELQARNLGADEVIRALQRQHVEAPAGRLEAGQREANVRVEGEALSLAEMARLVVATHDGAPVYLQDIALIEDGFQDQRQIAHANGLPAQGLGIIKQHGANTVEVADAVHKRVAELRKTLPEGLRLEVLIDTSQFIKESVSEIKVTLLLSALLTGLVCWLFLGSLSSTLNVLMAIPVSVFGTFAVMYFADFSMNTLTLLALSLSIGIVVDDAVMVLENIYRHAEAGKKRAAAAREGTEQIMFAALAATLAIIAIFLPVAFMKGIVGKFFFQFGVVLSVAVAISLLEAVTLAPARCAQILKVGGRENLIERLAGSTFRKLAGSYRRLLRHTLNFRRRGIPIGSLLVLLGSSVFFGGSLALIKLLPQEMTPAHDQGYYSFKVTAPMGSTIEYTDQVMRQIETELSSREEIAGHIAMAGVNGDVNLGMGFVTLKPHAERRLSQQESINALRACFERNPFPGTRITFADASQSGFGTAQRASSGVDFSIRGPDWQTLGRLSQVFVDEMQKTDVFCDVDNGFSAGMPEIEIIPDRQKTLAHNVDIKSLSDTIGALVGGTRVATFKEAGRRYDVRVRLLRDDRAHPEDIGNLLVRSGDGTLVRIAELAQIRMQPSLQSISRQGRERAITISANPAPGKHQDDALRMIADIAASVLPEGYSYQLGPAAKAATEAREGMIFALLLGLILAYMILASQFNSFLHPVTILLSLPFSLSGSLLALWLGGMSLNIYSMIGLILLMGIVKKNSILLVDYTNQLRREGKPCDAALLEACPVRLRPILMTSVATIAGALPAAFALGPGSELRVPMAVSIIGGLGLSTGLTLIVVPCFYSLVEQLRTQLKTMWPKQVDLPQVGVLERDTQKANAVVPQSKPGMGRGSTSLSS